MAKRSVKATASGIRQARQRFDYLGWTQEHLAALVGLNTRQSIWKFFKGAPIDRQYFIEICYQLGLDWEQIADLPSLPPELERRDSMSPRVVTPHHAPVGTAAPSSELSLLRMQAEEMAVEPLVPMPGLGEGRRLAEVFVERSVSCGDELIPAVSLFDRGNRFLLKGEFGSGRTTLARWLYLRQLRDHTNPQLALWLDLPLVYRDGDADLMRTLRQLLGDGEQQNRLEQYLRRGQLMLFIDGLDELSTSRAAWASRELSLFLGRYPSTGCLITTSLVGDHDWLLGCTPVALLPLAHRQARQHATQIDAWERWHEHPWFWHNPLRLQAMARDTSMEQAYTQLLDLIFRRMPRWSFWPEPLADLRIAPAELQTYLEELVRQCGPTFTHSEAIDGLMRQHARRSEQLPAEQLLQCAELMLQMFRHLSLVRHQGEGRYQIATPELARTLQERGKRWQHWAPAEVTVMEPQESATVRKLDLAV